MICVGCGKPITLTDQLWADATGRAFCGPGETDWHLPRLTPDEIARDAEAFVGDLRATALTRDRFRAGETQ